MSSARENLYMGYRLRSEAQRDDIGKVHTTASGIEYVVPINANSALPHKNQKWRRDNFGVVHVWQSANKLGWVRQQFECRVYRGECQDCGDLVVASRFIGGVHHQSGETRVGRWPLYCDGCRQVKREADNDRARYRMAELRRSGATRTSRSICDWPRMSPEYDCF